MAVVGGGVDQLLHVKPVMPQLDARGFRFLHVSSCFPRKGVDVLLRAYGKAFRNSEDVTLVIKTFPNPHNDVAAQLKQLCAEDPDFPHVELIERDFSDAELVGLYQSCHAYVATSRGEGLGLPLAEAMLFNLPVITTNWGGQLDFCDESTAWMCDFHYVKAQSHLSRSHSVWAEPNADHLAALLREVMEAAPAQRAARTVPARERVLRELTWKRVAERTEEAMRELAQQPTLRKEPKIAWISSWNTRCGIAMYSAFLASAIPPARLLVLANRTNERTAEDGVNVIRNWNQHHEETLDEVYDALIASGAGAVVIQYNFGFFSVQTLGRFIERLAAVGIASHCFFHATADLVRDGATISLRSIASSLARADRLYVHGVNDLNRLKDFGLVKNVVCFPQGVLPLRHGSSDAERHRLGLTGKKVIASYGFLLPHKGLQQLIEAFAVLARQDPDVHLLMANALYPISDSMNEQRVCEALLDKLKLQRRVTMVTDFLPDEQSLALLRAADLIVYPYQQTQESSSAAVRMGLAAGRPVAVTPLSIFDDVSDAVVRLPGTAPKEIAAGIRNLLADPKLLAETVAQAEQWNASRQWPLLSVRLMNIIDGLANQFAHNARHV
jgi:glycosyltransferase involved in cell wall biosynthesis